MVNLRTHLDMVMNSHSCSVTNEIVFNKLINLKSSKSAGPDGIHPRVLKETAVQLRMCFTDYIV